MLICQVNERGVAKSTGGMYSSVFKPKELKDGRVKVYGCSPGCLLVSIALSVFLTLALNGCLHLVG